LLGFCGTETLVYNCVASKPQILFVLILLAND
jgi:hypothetical protein